MKLDAELFEIVGYDHKRLNFTDEEFDKHIAVLNCITRYFKGRPDCGIVLYRLWHEYDTLLNLKEARKRK